MTDEPIFFDKDGNKVDKAKIPDTFTMETVFGFSEYEHPRFDLDAVKAEMLEVLSARFRFYHDRNPREAEIMFICHHKPVGQPNSFEIQLTIRKMFEMLDPSRLGKIDFKSTFDEDPEMQGFLEKLTKGYKPGIAQIEVNTDPLDVETRVQIEKFTNTFQFPEPRRDS